METVAEQLRVQPIHHRIAELLARAAKTPGWLAARSDVQRSTITRMLRGERRPSASTLAKLAPALGETFENLVRGTDAANLVDTDFRFVELEALREVIWPLVTLAQSNEKSAARIATLEKAATVDRKRRKRLERTEETLKQALEQIHAEIRRHETDAKIKRNGFVNTLENLAMLKASGLLLVDSLKRSVDLNLHTEFAMKLNNFNDLLRKPLPLRTMGRQE